jgi:hypothetical protein
MNGPARCGTPAGYQRHRRRNEQPCDDCRVANAAYMRDFRQRKPEFAAKARASSNARSRAVWRLAARYPDEYRQLLREEIGPPEKAVS